MQPVNLPRPACHVELFDGCPGSATCFTYVGSARDAIKVSSPPSVCTRKQIARISRLSDTSNISRHKNAIKFVNVVTLRTLSSPGIVVRQATVLSDCLEGAPPDCRFNLVEYSPFNWTHTCSAAFGLSKRAGGVLTIFCLVQTPTSANLISQSSQRSMRCPEWTSQTSSGSAASDF